MLSICEVSYLYRGRCYYGWYGWRGGSRKILVKLSIYLIYRELITLGIGAATSLKAGNTTPLGAGAATTASREVTRESYIVNIYLIYKELITLVEGAAVIFYIGK